MKNLFTMCFELVDRENAETYLNVLSMDNTHFEPFLISLKPFIAVCGTTGVDRNFCHVQPKNNLHDCKCVFTSLGIELWTFAKP